MEDKQNEEEFTVYVYPLTPNLTPDHVREIFGHFGKVKSVDFRTLGKESYEMSYGVVDFEKHDDAKHSVLHLNEVWQLYHFRARLTACG